MTRITMVRHGRAAAGWDDHVDPPLDAIGVRQAAAVAARMAAGPRAAIVSSPRRRCVETAEALARLWDSRPEIAAAVDEIPSPEGVPTNARAAWLRDATGATWAELGARYCAYRDAVVAWVAARSVDTVVFSHFVALNAVIGAALGDDRVVIHSLDNCSVSVVEINSCGLRLVEAGHEADTLIR